MFTVILLLSGCSLNEEKFTNDIYLIPEGYEGSIIVFFGIPNEPKLILESGYTTILVKEEFLSSMARSQNPNYGISITSTPMSDDGGYIINDKYFYIDSRGRKTPIQDDCIHHDGIGSFTNKDDIQIEFNTLQVTKSECGEEFLLEGKGIYFDQLKEVKDYWFNKLY